MFHLLLFFFLVCNFIFELFFLLFKFLIFLSEFLMSFLISLLLFFLVDFIGLFLFPISSIVISCFDKLLHILLILLHFFKLLLFIIFKITSLSSFNKSLRGTFSICLKSLINLWWFLRKVILLLLLSRIRSYWLDLDKSRLLVCFFVEHSFKHPLYRSLNHSLKHSFEHHY